MMKKAKVIAKTADHEALIKLIQAAKEDHDLYQQLTHLLKQNNRNRSTMIKSWNQQLAVHNQKSIIEAITLLKDDKIAALAARHLDTLPPTEATKKWGFFLVMLASTLALAIYYIASSSKKSQTDIRKTRVRTELQKNKNQKSLQSEPRK